MTRPTFCGKHRAQGITQTEVRTMQDEVLGIDIGKTWFHNVGCNRAGKVVMRKKLNRTELLETIANLPQCLIGMEACPGSQFLARELANLGHDVRLIAPKHVKPYLPAQKNDFNDARAIAEAVTRPMIRFVPVKSASQLDLQALHRVRSRVVTDRTAVINQIRGFLLGVGIPIKSGRVALDRCISTVLEDTDNALTPTMRLLLQRLRRQWKAPDTEIAEITQEIKVIAKADANCRRIQTIPGIRLLGATAIVAAIGNGSAFRSGRQLAAWLGMVPRQHSTGGKARLGHISKHGDTYIRTLLMHGARAVVQNLKRERHRFGEWLSHLELRAHKNVVIGAVANKLARIVWCVLSRGEDYRGAIQTPT
jgi:transposase